MEENNAVIKEPMTYTVEPHPLSGTRQRAQDLLWELPEDLKGDTVVVDVSKMKAYAQCFVDELCKQIVEVRNAANLRIVTDNEKLRQQISYSAELRRFSERISFV